MIADERKDEEYREIKPYWASRLVNQQAEGGEVLFDEYGGYCCVTGEPEYKPFTHVLFINGYRKDDNTRTSGFPSTFGSSMLPKHGS